MPLTHYKASWVNWNENWPEPVWPLKKNDGKYVVRGTIARELINPWKEFEAKGVGVMVGEFGVFNQTPHRYALSWMNDAWLSSSELDGAGRLGTSPAALVFAIVVDLTSLTKLARRQARQGDGGIVARGLTSLPGSCPSRRLARCTVLFMRAASEHTFNRFDPAIVGGSFSPRRPLLPPCRRSRPHGIPSVFRAVNGPAEWCAI